MMLINRAYALRCALKAGINAKPRANCLCFKSQRRSMATDNKTKFGEISKNLNKSQYLLPGPQNIRKFHSNGKT